MCSGETILRMSFSNRPLVSDDLEVWTSFPQVMPLNRDYM